MSIALRGRRLTASITLVCGQLFSSLFFFDFHRTNFSGFRRTFHQFRSGWHFATHARGARVRRRHGRSLVRLAVLCWGGGGRLPFVTPSTYGTDNRVTLDAMAQIGATARGVAVVDTSVADAELRRMNDLGIRGIRFNLVQAGATTIEMIEPLSKRVNDLGWHIQIHMKGEQIAGIEDLLLRVPSPIVFDHLGRLAQPNALDSPGFKTISKLIDKGKTWVKLSGAYQDSKVGAPSYSDTVPVARAYIKAAPQRVVWASDWPHPTEKEKPNDAVLFDLLAEWAPDPASHTAILVQNPATLYGFPKSA
jgi:D-galactarolactone isomerase